LLALRLEKEFEEEYISFVESQLSSYEKTIDQYGPFYFEFYRVWRRLFIEYRQGKIKFFPTPAAWIGGIQDFNTPVQLNAKEIFDNIKDYSDEIQWLRVSRIKIESPGGFNFTGVGEIIKEFRELIKDIWFRNSQENTLGQLSIIDKFLEMKAKHLELNTIQLPANKSRKELAKTINKEINNLKQLEDWSKLDNVGDNIDYTPE
jgi:hypothetical protein